MAIGYSDSIRSQVVQTCTPELLHRAMRSSKVKMVCAQLVDALESKLRGEVCNDDYEEMKKKLKSQLPILTPHATFRNGRRKNDEAIPSGLSIYDIDHIPNPRGYWEEKKKVLAGKLLGGTKFSGGVLAEAGSESGGTKVSGDLQSPASCGQARNVLSVLDLIVLVHVTPSTQGLRLVFVIPEGMDIAMAQRWMSQQLEDSEYDTVVKDLARPSFLVPEEYLLYINEEELFKERKITSTSSALPGGGASLLAGDCKSPGRLADSNPGRFAGASLLARDCKSPGRLTDSNPGCFAGASLLAGDCKSPERLTDSNSERFAGANANHKVQSSNLKVQSKESSNLNVQSNDYVQDNRFPGTNGDNAVSSGSAVQPAQPGDSHRVDDPHLGPAGDNQDAGGVAAQRVFPKEYNGIAYEKLVAKLVELLGGEPEHGSRNAFIFTLACYLRYLCDDNPAWIKQVIPTFGEEQKRAFATVESACNRRQAHRLPGIVRKAIKLSQDDESKAMCAGCFDDDDFGDIHNPESYFYNIHQMPQKLPKLIKLLVSKTPEIYRPAVSQAVFPPLASHLLETRFRYIDNVEHEATLMQILCAPTGSGKESVSQPINRIMADIRKRDEEQRERERKWKDECNSKGANKDRRERPEGLVIQEVNIDMTNPAFVLRMKEAENHFLYAKVNELNLFDALKGKTNQHFRIMELAFDLGNYGQDRVGPQSVTETVQVRFNWNASCTPRKCRDYFRRVVTDGPISRISFSTIERRPCGSEIPVYGTYDAAFDEALKPYIDNLLKARGLVNCPQALRLARKLVEENAEFSRLSQNFVFENLSFRANVIAYLKACVLYVANGMKWEASIEDFIRWSERYDLWCKLKLFGQMIYDADTDRADLPKTAPHGPKNLLEQLPDEFTMEDYIKLRRQEGYEDDNNRRVNIALNQWVHRGYVVRIGNQEGDYDYNYSSIFRKLKFLKEKG